MANSVPEDGSNAGGTGKFTYTVSLWEWGKVLIKPCGILDQETYNRILPIPAPEQQERGRGWYVLVDAAQFEGVEAAVRPHFVNQLAILFGQGILGHVALVNAHPAIGVVARYMQLVYTEISYSMHNNLEDALQYVDHLQNGGTRDHISDLRLPASDNVEDLEQELQRRARTIEDEISRREEAESALDEYKAYQSAVMESGNVGVWAVDLNLRVTYFNKVHASNMLRLHGRQMEQGHSILDYKISSHSDVSVKARYERALAGETFEIQDQIPDRIGNFYWISIEYRPIYKLDQIIGVVALSRDISEKKERDQQFTDYKEMIRSLSENVQEGLYRSSLVKGLLYVNHHFCRLFGYSSPEAMMGIDFAQLYAQPGRREELARLMQEHGAFRNQEVLFKRRDGSEFWGLLSSTRSWNADSEEVFDGAIRDINAFIISQKELQAAKEEAERAAKSKSLFLSQMSHEIRTPLNAILGNAYLLLDEIGEPRFRMQLENMVRSGQHLLQIINDILDFSRIEAGRISLYPQAFNLPQLLNELRDQLTFQAVGKNINLQLELDADLPERIFADKVKLSQVLLNLGGNAIKFTEEGTVTLRASLLERQADKCRLMFKVVDTGIGIAEDKLETIFESFSQADGDINRRFGGTGLGLAIASGILDAMGGSIQVSSQLNEGTEFRVELEVPEEAGNKKDNLVNSVPVRPDLQQLRVLIVEDNDMNRVLLERMLELWNARVFSTGNGTDAIELMGRELPEVVLLDLHMPDMDGFQVFENIRHYQVPVIALTADAFEETKRKALGLGMAAYLAKPFNPVELADLLKTMRERA